MSVINWDIHIDALKVVLTCGSEAGAAGAAGAAGGSVGWAGCSAEEEENIHVSVYHVNCIYK